MGKAIGGKARRNKKRLIEENELKKRAEIELAKEVHELELQWEMS